MNDGQAYELAGTIEVRLSHIYGDYETGKHRIEVVKLLAKELQSVVVSGEQPQDDLSMLILAMRECADDYLAGNNPNIALITLRAHALVLREDMSPENKT